MRRLLIALLAVATICFWSCSTEELNSLDQRVSALESDQINAIEQQIQSIASSIIVLQNTSDELKEYLSVLQKEQTVLAKTDKELSDQITELTKKMGEEISNAEAEILAEVETQKSIVEAQLGVISQTINNLSNSYAELDNRISTLQSYIDSEIQTTKDWVAATFVTLEQYNATTSIVANIQTQIQTLTTQIASLQNLVSVEEMEEALSSLDGELRETIQDVIQNANTAITTASESIKAAYTKDIADALSASEISLKAWINEQLTAYYTAIQVEAKLLEVKNYYDYHLNSQKTYLTSLITNLEISLTTTISNNEALINALDIGSSSQVAGIATKATAVSNTALEIVSNAKAIIQNVTDNDACEGLIAANKTLIASNQTTVSALYSVNAGAIGDNASDIASTAALISANAVAIFNNAKALSDNAAEVIALQAKLGKTITEITAAYKEAISDAISNYNGIIVGKIAQEVSSLNSRIDAEVATINAAIDALAGRVTTCEKDIKSIKNTIYLIQEDIKDIQNQISDLLSRIQSFSYIPRYSDGKAIITYTNNEGITPGTAELDFAIRPSEAAAELIKVWQSALYVKAVYTITKAAPEMVDLSIENASVSDGVLSIVVDGTPLSEAFFLSQISASIQVGITDGKNDIASDYIQLAPWTTDVVAIEDNNFKSYLLENYDSNADGEISVAEAKNVTDIDAPMLNISSLKGIEYFSNLKTIDVSSNKLTSLSLVHCPKLTDIAVNGNKLQSLNLSGLASLKNLDCSSNKLERLDVSSASGLLTLYCASNEIGFLVLKNNKALKELQCASNNLASLDLSNNTKLTSIYCGKNLLKTLDLSKQTALIYLDCSYNSLSGLNLGQNEALTELSCGNNSLSSLDLFNNTALTEMDCKSNLIESLDVTRLSALQTLDCSSNSLSSLDVSKSSALTALDCTGNPSMKKLWLKDSAQQTSMSINKDNATEIFFNSGGIYIPDAKLKAYLVANYDDDGDGEISIAESENVTLINCSGRSIADLTGLEVCTNITYVNCANNSLAKIDFHTLAKLKTLICYGNPLSDINLNNCKSLSSFKIADADTEALVSADDVNWVKVVGYSGATTLKFSIKNVPSIQGLFFTGSSVLKTLDFRDNSINYIRAYANTSLTSLLVNDSLVSINANGCTSLTGIDVSSCTKLQQFVLYNCGLASVDVTSCPQLWSLKVDKNNISTVDITHNPKLKILEIAYNQLTKLDVTQNPLLERLDAGANSLSSVNVRNSSCLKYFSVALNDAITILNVSNNTQLETLILSDTSVDALDLTNNTLLKSLQISRTAITSLDLREQTNTITFSANGMTQPVAISYLPGQDIIPNIGAVLSIGGVPGVVYSNASKAVKLVSMEEGEAAWSTETGVLYSGERSTDFELTMESVTSRGIAKYPAFKWCSLLGTEWNLPNKTETESIYSNKERINTSLNDVGAAQISTQYWTCNGYFVETYPWTEKAWFIDFSNESSSHMSTAERTQTKKVRAVRTL